MFYFKKVYINDLSKTEVERLLRKASLKRVDSLDLISASTDVGTDKLFLGFIGKSALLFTRLHTSLERFLPKLIIKLPLDTDECYYQLRLKSLSAIVCFVLALLLMLSLFQTVTGEINVDGFFTVLLICIVYFGLILLEVKITSSRINKALSQLLSTIPLQVS
ncbi:hypothetical protein IDJ77_19480 [Mucilaginibacter sp. ZT4R22]|uniref:Uncharacterized protein n=2 Tax=Mucilaginibacter pankratovii TaxID=2772110 RepID=A0ABR7WX46_9SPHI|nr:hypothetical protein [Mucilaginibacter pankratovii]